MAQTIKQDIGNIGCLKTYPFIIKMYFKIAPEFQLRRLFLFINTTISLNNRKYLNSL